MIGTFRAQLMQVNLPHSNQPSDEIFLHREITVNSRGLVNDGSISEAREARALYFSTFRV